VWSTVLVVALLSGFNPVRLGITLLVISRPRPMQFLFFYWLGCLIASAFLLLLPLVLLYATPLLGSFAHDLAIPSTGASSTARHVQFGLGVLVLSLAAAMAIHASTRRRASVRLPGGNASSLTEHSNSSTAISRLLGRTQDEPTGGGSPIRRLLGRVYDAWEAGSLWVAVVIGIFTGPGIDGAFYLLAIIVPSGAPVGAQFSAAIVFIILMLGIVEITLVSYLITPVKTQAVVQVLHDWAQTHGRKVLIAMFVFFGVAMMAQGFGLV